MFNYLFITSLFAIWQISFLGLIKFADINISKNILHFIHALIYVIYYKTEYDKSYLIDFTASFYSYDLIFIMSQIIKKKATFNTHGAYIIHHIIAIYGLYICSMDISSHFILMMYYILENSNFMLYVAYHVNKSYYKHTYFLRIIELLQYLWYTYFRVVYFSKFLINEIHEIYSHKIILSYFLLASLYLMGVYWSYKLFLKNIKNISLIIEEIKPKIE